MPLLPVRVIDARADHLHGPFSDPTGADVPPEAQVQDQPQRAGQGAGEHHANLGQPGQSRRQVEAVTGAQDVRSQLGQEEDEEAAGEHRRDDGAQRPVQEHAQNRVSHRAEEQQRTCLDGKETCWHEENTSALPPPSLLVCGSPTCSQKLTKKFPLLLIGSRRLAARFSSSDPQLWNT